MQFWFNIDSLILMSYALILIFVVLTQREKLVNYKSYFKFSELFKFGDDADVEDDMQFSPIHPLAAKLGRGAESSEHHHVMQSSAAAKKAEDESK